MPGDPEVLEIFTFPLTAGDPKTALKDPDSLVLSEQAAKKYFGNEDPLGKIITVDNTFPMKVTGVMKDVPGNSTYSFDILMPLEFYARNIHKEVDLKVFTNQNFFVFVRLRKGSSFDDLNRKIREFVVATYGKDDYVPVLWPFSRFHLYRLGDGGGSIERIRLIGFLGAFILLIACINFMNLTTARSGTRSKEIGMRKVVGAFRRDLIKQFYFEASRLVLLANIIAWPVAWYLLERWLQSFQYRTRIRLDIFIIARALTVFIALMTVSYQSVKAATAKPVNSLRYE